jgi:hypothetical protein
VWGFSESAAGNLYPAFPTLRFINDLGEVAQNEWDVLVTRRGATDAAPHLFILAVEGPDALTRDFGWAGTDKPASVSYTGLTAAREFEVPADLPRALHQVVIEWLAHAAQSQQAQQHILAALRPTMQWSATSQIEEVIRPFLRTSDGRIIAGSFRRFRGNAECWCLPSYISNLLPWALVAIPEWRELSPDRFPHPAPWQARDEWRTPAELTLLTEQQRLEDAKAAALSDFQGKLDAVDQRLQTTGAAADANERALLTSQADSLKNVVIGSLRHLGFAVEDMDSAWPLGDKREDLRLKNPDHAEQIALVEVRGYARGAQLSDLMRMQRFAARFQKDEGRMPDRLWYVVNHSLADDPSQRQPALASNPSEVETFAESGGLVIDTVELFKIWQAVDARRVDPAIARAMLTKATGRFSAAPVLAVADLALSEQRTG